MACSPKPNREPIACQVDEGCPQPAKCILGACIAGSTPNPIIQVRATQAELVAHRDITFDGSSSRDNNPGGTLKSFTWAVRRGRSATCDATVTSGSRPSFTTNFQCPGEFVVELKVTNDLALTASVQATLEIAPSTNPPTITSIGSDLVVAHRCEGSPVLCRAFAAKDGATAFQLSVAATDVEDGDKVTYTWTYDPPAGLDPATLHVTFDPSASYPTPLVRIASDGAIAGDWTFQAHATDSNGLTSVKAQRITVGNSAPVATLPAGGVVLGHSYLAATDRYIATALVHATVSDPEGDAISATELTMSESVPSTCAFRVLSSRVDGTAYTGEVELSCSGAAAQELIGQVTRELKLAVTDANGATATDVRALTVSDAPPSLTWSPPTAVGTQIVPHTVVPCPAGAESASCFAIDAPVPYAVSDVEGDPVAVRVSAAGLPATGTFFTASPGRFSLLVPVTKPAVFRRSDSTSPATFTVAAADPWSSASPATATFGVSIANRAPTVDVPSTARSTGHWYSDLDRAYHATFNIGVAADPDGDPLTASAFSNDGVCSAVGVTGGLVQVACRVPYDYAAGGPPPVAKISTIRSVGASVSDPWLAGAATPAVVLTVENGSPSIGNQATAVNVETPCTCNASMCEWQPQGPGTVHFDPLASDPDGDPLWMTFTFSNGLSTSGLACLPPDCAVRFDVSLLTGMVVKMSDGQLDVTRSYALVAQCTNDTTQRCGPLPGKTCP